MGSLSIDDLTPNQQTILTCVSAQPGCYTRSELAKLLVGSRSSRAAELAEHPDFGRLAGHGRKEITFEIDTLLQQHFLALDRFQKVILAHSAAEDC